MTFTSNIFFIGLLPWFLLIYGFFTKKNTRKIFLFIANSVFYIWGGVGAFFFVCVLCLVTYIFCSLCRKKKNKVLFALGLVLIACPLVVVKYTEFVIRNINDAFNTSLAVPSLLVPIGISFITFEAISCLCDIYKGRETQKVSLFDVYLYMTFFPTVTSGPIMRISQFREGYQGRITTESFAKGIERVAIGLCKKMLIADKIALLADYYFDGTAAGNSYSASGLWIGAIAYTFQLYFDFSGYSDMAIGFGGLLGFSIPENFDKPYQAASIQDFWRRWHISLSRWFRDYIYIPLGGNRCSMATHIRNLLVVWLLTGLWHGADWTFVIWGVGYLILLLAEKYIPFMGTIGKHWYGHVYALFFINLLWVPFRAADVSSAWKYIVGMFRLDNLGGLEEKAVSYLPFLCACALLCLPWNRLREKYKNVKWLEYVRGAVLIALVALAVCAVINSSYTPYIYGNF